MLPTWFLSNAMLGYRTTNQSLIDGVLCFASKDSLAVLARNGSRAEDTAGYRPREITRKLSLLICHNVLSPPSSSLGEFRKKISLDPFTTYFVLRLWPKIEPRGQADYAVALLRSGLAQRGTAGAEARHRDHIERGRNHSKMTNCFRLIGSVDVQK